VNHEPISDPKIAVVFATMNRWKTAAACVRALVAQTHPPELVIVADNVSGDETLAELSALKELPFEFIVHRMEENLGNAGGIHAAMELAFSRGADAVWILDDDSWPRPEALAAMLAEPFDPEVIRHPLQIDPATGKLTSLGQTPTEKTPRSFALIPGGGNYLVAAGQGSDTLIVYRRDPENGTLTPLKTYPCGKSPAWVLGVKF